MRGLRNLPYDFVPIRSRSTAGPIAEQAQLLFFYAVFHLAPCAVKLIVESLAAALQDLNYLMPERIAEIRLESLLSRGTAL